MGSSLPGRIGRALVALAVLAAFAAGFAPVRANVVAVELLEGRVGGERACGMPLESVRRLFGVPSHYHDTLDGSVSRYAHLGLEVHHHPRAEDALESIKVIVVYLQRTGDYRPFLEPVIGRPFVEGTRAEAVRLLEEAEVDVLAGPTLLLVVRPEHAVEVNLEDGWLHNLALWCK